jgi:hypothetical protein
MNKINFSMTGESLTVFVGGTPTTFRAGTVQYSQIAKAILEQDWDAIPALLTPGGALAKYLGDRFKVDGETLTFDGVTLPEALTERIATMAQEGQDPSPLLRFYERLHKNPSHRSRTQVFAFLKHLDIAIEADGTFLAYKGVKEDYTDQYTGTIANNPGQVHEMARNLISDDPNEACHFGFHVGALQYASGFGPVVVICRVDPENVVCVPHDYSAQKMRVSRYEVVGEWSGEKMGVVADAEDLPYEDYEEDFDDYEDEDEGEDEDLDEDYEERQQTLTLPMLTRGDLATGTVFMYEGAPGVTFAVGNVRLPGAPQANSHEMYPSMDGYVTVVWPVPGASMAPAPVKIEVAPANPMDTLDTKGMMKCSIEDLRKYASGRLKIHGASKIPGGKSTLVAKIMKVRRRLAK